MSDVQTLLRLGADKVIVNSEAIERPEFITEISRKYGSQCVVLSIDARKNEYDTYEVFSHAGTKSTGLDPVLWAREGSDRGAGEVMITSIERDGWLQGYDLELCKKVSNSVSVPVLILGGAGNWNHFAEGFRETAAAAVCTQNIFHFTEKSIQSAKQFLHKQGINVRL